ncbi:MAG: ChbG/HpnK family deacetylase [Pseudomonadota bacterium]
MTSGSPWTCLIVNADDYGYFNCVSQGILKSASHGIVTATGIFANSAHFAEHAGWLRDNARLDLGVHLNITDQIPLTINMRNKLSRWKGRFPDKYTMSRVLLSGKITTEDVRSEWRAQIERCLEKDLEIRFLNSHEHIHILPSLFPVLQALAGEYGISHIRFPTSEPFQKLTTGALVRDILIKMMGLFNRPRLTNPAARFIGMGESGKLSTEYLERRLPKLKPGHVYELMCHPGYYDANEISDSRLLNYHDWKREFDALTNPAVRDMLYQHRIRLIGYRHLQIHAGRFVVQDEKE